MLNTAVSLLTLILAQASALRAAELHFRTTIFDLLVNGELDRADRLATDMWGRPATRAGTDIAHHRGARILDELTDFLDAAAASSMEQLFIATVDDGVVVIYPASARIRDHVLSAVRASESLTVGESTETGLADLGRAHREAEQALGIGLQSHRRHTEFADIGAAGMLQLFATPHAAAFAESLLRPLVDHDASGRGDLVSSLGVWLDHNGQWDAAAAELGVHRHTLRHRIRRASDLLGRDLDVAAVRVELWAAIQLLDGRRGS